MILEEDYLKAKQIVQEYEKQSNISVVTGINSPMRKCTVMDDDDEKECHPDGCKSCDYYR